MGILGLRKKDPKADLLEILGGYELPSFPRIINDAIDKLSSADVNLNEVGELLGRDPGVSMKLLSMVNSATFAPRRPISSVGQAVAMLGRNQVESLLISLAVSNTVSSSTGGFDFQAFWSLSARRAAMAAALATLADPPSRSAAFTAALLQDMAVPVLVVRVGEYPAVNTSSAHTGHSMVVDERDHFGWDHSEVGALMAASWGFPDELASAIADHHTSLEVPPSTSIANTAALMAEAADDDGQEALLEHMAAVFGLATDVSLELLERSEIEGREIATLFL